MPETATHRDRRALSRMAGEMRVVHLRLEAWGRWARDTPTNGLPAHHIIARLMDEGPGASHTSRAPIEIPDAIAEVDKAVTHLEGDDRRVIRAYYLLWEPREVLAQRLGMSTRKMDAVLNRARWRICGYISAVDYVTSFA